MSHKPHLSVDPANLVHGALDEVVQSPGPEWFPFVARRQIVIDGVTKGIKPDSIVAWGKSGKDVSSQQAAKICAIAESLKTEVGKLGEGKDAVAVVSVSSGIRRPMKGGMWLQAGATFLSLKPAIGISIEQLKKLVDGNLIYGKPQVGAIIEV